MLVVTTLSVPPRWRCGVAPSRPGMPPRSDQPATSYLPCALELPAACGLAGRRVRRCAELKNSRLGACVQIHLERVVVRPGDVQTAGALHDADGAVSFARITGCRVFIGIPCVSDAAGFGVDRHVGNVALLRRDAKTPFVDDL